MRANDAARRLIMESEGLSLAAYRCPAGVWTIGYGHTGDVKPGQMITAHQAEAILEYDLGTYEDGVSAMAPAANANQFGAMVSLAFNVGLGAFAKSTLLREHLAGHHRNASAEFTKWVFDCHGKKLPGLVTRRSREAALYLEPVQ